MPILVRIALLVLTALVLVPATANAQRDCTNPRVDPKQCADQGGQAPEDDQESEDEYAGRVCATERSGEQCAPGRGRKTAGGGNTGNVSHKGWPAITGVLWKVNVAKGSHRLVGDALNDELLGHHGNDTTIG